MGTSTETSGGGGGAPHAPHGAHDAFGDDDAFDLPPLDAFPRHAEPTSDASAAFQSFPTRHEEEEEDALDRSFDDQRSVHSDEFVDAEAYLEDHKPGEDSFLREATGGEANVDWSDDEDMADATGRRASAIFVPKSRNMERVEFSSPQRSMRKPMDAHRNAPHKANVRANLSQRASNAAFSTTNTALSSDYDLHVDHRLALTPNSVKHLQLRERQPTEDLTLSGSMDDTIGERYTLQAQQVVDARAISEVPRVPGTPARPSSAERAMQAGPGVIKKALREIDSTLEIESRLKPMSFDDGDSDDEFDTTLDKLLRHASRSVEAPDLTDETSRAPDTRTFGQNFRGGASRPDMTSEGVQAGYNPVSDASVHVTSRAQTTDNRPLEYLSGIDVMETAREPTAVQEKGVMTISSLRPHAPTSHVKRANTVKMPAEANIASQPTRPVRTADAWTQAETKAKDTEAFSASRASHIQPVRPKEHRPEVSFRRGSLRESADTPLRTTDFPERENLDVNVPVRTRTQLRHEPMQFGTVQREKDGDKRTSIKATVNSLPLATAVPNQMARRCRRFLCIVGERLNEQIVFSNGSSKVGRICVSLLPLSTGCQQFSVSPAVLEVQPRSRSAFTVMFEASRAGVVAGIFQFRAVGVDGLFEPYEVLIEASVRGDLQLPPALPLPKSRKTPAQAIKSSPQNDRVTQLPAQALASVKITPTFLRFTNANGSTGQDFVVGGSSIRITNSTAESIHFQLKNSHEHLQLSQARGELPAGSEVKIEVHPICRPFGVSDDAARDWCGSMTVVVGDVLSREVSIVIEHNALCALPSFDEVARVRQAISAQTDSFYYTKKVNRRGLYFHARAVECGSCAVGESHQVPVYICNGSESPMTVFLQALQDPFSCDYQPTTLQARKFIEVPVTFRPKATGKVATCLVAYTVSGKAAVTLIARGGVKATAAEREEN